MGSFRIATYNVNSIRSRLPVVMGWLKEHAPDVFCMQETKVEDGQFPVSAFEDVGYHVIFSGGKKYNGVAIASRSAAEGVVRGLSDGGPPDTDRLIAAVFSDVVVVNSYVPQGREKESEHFRYKLEWFKRLENFFSRRWAPEMPLIWCGDLNVAPEDIDVHDPKRLLGHVCFSPEVSETFYQTASWGLKDVFRIHHPQEPGQYTFFDYRVPNALKRKMGWRIDHILATEPFAVLSTACEIDLRPRLAPKPSDHTVLWATFAKE
jgi:exodeoxyribonuclease III